MADTSTTLADDEESGLATSLEIDKRPHKRVVLERKTQCFKVGKIRCLFVSCFYGGRAPLLTLGPDWPYSTFILLFAAMILAYFCVILHIVTESVGRLAWIQYCGIALNLGLLFAGILKNPGIPQTLIDRLLKRRLTGVKDSESPQPPPLESESDRLTLDQTYCQVCQLQTLNMVHCDDCGVCIEDFDHHCVFFSKCIGGGNIVPFYGSMVGVLVNFVISIGLILGATYYQDES